MKKLIILCLSILIQNVNAQHCPYDGASVLFIKNKNPKTTSPIKLVEIVEPNNCKCSIKPDQNILEFENSEKLFRKSFKHNIEIDIAKFAFDKENFAVIIGQADEVCMIDIAFDSSIASVERKYEIQYYKNNQLQKIPLDRKYVFGMCNRYGTWNRFRAMEIDAD